MAIDYNRIRLSGSVTGGEIWSIGLAYQTDFGTGPVKDYDDLLDWATAIGALNAGGILPASTRALLSTSATIDRVRAEYIDSVGTLAQVAEWSPAAPVAGTGVANKPPQVAIVVSLLTGRPGRSFRGRTYIPALNVTSMSGIQANTAVTNALATDFAGWLSAVGSAAGVDAAMRPAVFSEVLGTAQLVTTVSVDTVMDTQRRRRNSLIGTRSTAVVP